MRHWFCWALIWPQRRRAAWDELIDTGSADEDEWQDVIATNLSGPFYCSRAALPLLKQQGGGWIINIASLAGTNPFGGMLWNIHEWWVSE